MVGGVVFDFLDRSIGCGGRLVLVLPEIFFECTVALAIALPVEYPIGSSARLIGS
jgi:hypothetical protein